MTVSPTASRMTVSAAGGVVLGRRVGGSAGWGAGWLLGRCGGRDAGRLQGTPAGEAGLQSIIVYIPRGTSRGTRVCNSSTKDNNILPFRRTPLSLWQAVQCVNGKGLSTK